MVSLQSSSTHSRCFRLWVLLGVLQQWTPHLSIRFSNWFLFQSNFEANFGSPFCFILLHPASKTSSSACSVWTGDACSAGVLNQVLWGRQEPWWIVAFVGLGLTTQIYKCCNETLMSLYSSRVIFVFFSNNLSEHALHSPSVETPEHTLPVTFV